MSQREAVCDEMPIVTRALYCGAMVLALLAVAQLAVTAVQVVGGLWRDVVSNLYFAFAPALLMASVAAALAGLGAAAYRAKARVACVVEQERRA